MLLLLHPSDYDIKSWQSNQLRRFTIEARLKQRMEDSEYILGSVLQRLRIRFIFSSGASTVRRIP